MIAFATLFLGLVFGTVQVELVAAHGVARVELQLDGVKVAEVTEPWRAALDLGAELSPHELIAVARDAAGREVGRARQWVNRPRALAEAEFLLEPGSGGSGRVARLTWRCVTREEPRALAVTLDGLRVVVEDPARIVLPRHDPARLHVLRAELDFGDGVTATADASFGGGTRRVESLATLTAVPVVVESARRARLEELRDVFTAAGAPVTAAAVDEGPAEVVFVLAGRVADELVRLVGRGPSTGTFLAKGQAFRLLWCTPSTESQRLQELTLFPMSPDTTPDDGTFLLYASRLQPPSTRSAPRVAQAVATAALSAAGRDRRRAVVLVLGPEARDAGTLTPQAARGFLERLRVPLFVWSVAARPPALAAAWGPVVDVSTGKRLAKAVEALSAHLETQRVVWVEGTWLPQAVAPRAGVRGVALAR